MLHYDSITYCISQDIETDKQIGCEWHHSALATGSELCKQRGHTGSSDLSLPDFVLSLKQYLFTSQNSP